MKDLQKVENDFNSNGRIENIKRALVITLMLLNTFAQGRNEAKVYNSGQL